MTDWATLSDTERETRLSELQERYDGFRERKLALDMTRGKPCPEQLDLANGMLTLVGPDDCRSDDGVDGRNYGGVDGLPDAKRFFADFLEVGTEEVIVGGNSSLAMMHDAVLRALLLGVPGGEGPWKDLPQIRFLCPAPGYDRHFAICETYGIEMIPVEMTASGPDMDAVEERVASDESIRGIWCVPKYGNPTGVTFSDETVDRLAKMRCAAPDFRIFWDNAYSVHHLTDTPDRLKNILASCKAAGHPDRVYIFGSTSKVTFAGAGIGAMGASCANCESALAAISKQTIGPDKLNQLRHVRFLKDMDGVAAHMRRHADIIRPKFDLVLETLDRELGGKGIAEWTRPRGGYFVSLDVPDGCAKEVVAMAGEVGVKLTNAGATFPYGRDPRDRNIRIAPTLPALNEIRSAMEVLCVCVQIAALRGGRS